MEPVGADFGLIFRCEEVTDETPDTFYGYYVGVGSLGQRSQCRGPQCQASRRDLARAAWNQIGTYTTDKVNPSEVTRLKVVVYGNTFTTFVKGERDSDYTKIMSSTTELHPNGFIGLRSYKQAFFADNLTIRAVHGRGSPPRQVLPAKWKWLRRWSAGLATPRTRAPYLAPIPIPVRSRKATSSITAII